MELSELELHDAPLDGIELSFLNDSLSIYYSDYDDDRQVYLLMKLHFEGVENISFPHFKSTDCEKGGLEITNADFEIGEEYSSAEFIFICWAGPSYELSFRFTNYSVVKVGER
jgi:hypothetical protein